MPSAHLSARGTLAAALGLCTLALSGCHYQPPPPEAPMPAAAPTPAEAPPAPGEFRPGVPMAAAIARVLGGAVAAERKTNLGFDRGVTFMGALLRPKAFINWRMQMEAGTRYAFLGGGDDGASDVDLAVIDANGQTLARDQLADAKPVVDFTPRQTGVHVVRMTLAQASGPAFCALAVLRQGGFTVPVKNLTASLQKIMAAGRLASQRAAVRFHEEPNQWALFGAVLRPGDTTTISGLHLEGRQHVFVLAGDANAKVLDLSLLDARGSLVKKDDKPDQVAVVVARTVDGSYQVAITNVESTGPALVTAVILDVL
ncbi:MAG: hypothetical protein HY906_14300 [Deltaproteobacteria bacterium]|nr:hypothetical protein [Deltaproteobacteria bacterium]